MLKIVTAFFIMVHISSVLHADSGKNLTGKKVFETYCWGCHHQTAVAFGPSFAQIASQRNADEIRGMITDPAAVSKVLGYKRNAMPPFTLTEQELKLITAYILSFKDTDTNTASSKENK